VDHVLARTAPLLRFVIEHAKRFRLALQVGLAPVIEPRRLSHRQLALGVATFDPEAVRARQLAAVDVELRRQRTRLLDPGLATMQVLQAGETVIEIETHAALMREPIAEQQDRRHKVGRAVLDGDLFGQAKARVREAGLGLRTGDGGVRGLGLERVVSHGSGLREEDKQFGSNPAPFPHSTRIREPIWRSDPSTREFRRATLRPTRRLFRMT